MISISAASFGSSTSTSRWLLGFLKRPTDPAIRNRIASCSDGSAERSTRGPLVFSLKASMIIDRPC
jgi:hypothetical protein